MSDGTQIPPACVETVQQCYGIRSATHKRSGVTNTMRSRIVRIGAKHLPKDELNQMLIDANFAPLFIERNCFLLLEEK